MNNQLFSSFKLGPITLRNRIVMAPMTRCRATPDHVPTELMASYYAARAEAGLIVTEGIAPSPDGVGYARIPGLYNEDQQHAWRQVTGAVHARGGAIYAQLMHTGRVSHPLNMPAGARIQSASAIGQSGTMWTDQQQMQPYPVPHAMSESDIQAAITSFSDAAYRAREAGFDGVELHAANGYLLDQFLNTASNRRTDGWGGSVHNRARMVLETARHTGQRIGFDRVGIRLSPYGVFNDMTPDAEMDALYAHLAVELGSLGLAYVHLVDHSAMGAPPVKPEIKESIRKSFGSTAILAGGYDRTRAEQDLAVGAAHLIAFGRPFISNPDLPRRLREDIPLAEPDPSTFYTPGEKGYSDYPPAP